jgi:hypothetical protein
VTEGELHLVDEGALLIDDDGAVLTLDPGDANLLFSLTDGLDAATVSACPECRSRTLAAVAFVDLLDASPPHPRGPQLGEFADDAPTLHVYVLDRSTVCDHRRWLDPGYGEWAEAVGHEDPRARH